MDCGGLSSMRETLRLAQGGERRAGRREVRRLVEGARVGEECAEWR